VIVYEVDQERRNEVMIPGIFHSRQDRT